MLLVRHGLLVAAAGRQVSRFCGAWGYAEMWRAATIPLLCHKAAIICRRERRLGADFERRPVNWLGRRDFLTSIQGHTYMRKIILAAAIAGAALSISACSQKTADATSAAADSASADAAANADAAATAVSGAATDAASATSEAATDATGSTTTETTTATTATTAAK
jgi:hypothetical protein